MANTGLALMIRRHYKLVLQAELAFEIPNTVVKDGEFHRPHGSESGRYLRLCRNHKRLESCQIRLVSGRIGRVPPHKLNRQVLCNQHRICAVEPKVAVIARLLFLQLFAPGSLKPDFRKAGCFQHGGGVFDIGEQGSQVGFHWLANPQQDIRAADQSHI